jgi:hypothetical protein
MKSVDLLFSVVFSVLDLFAESSDVKRTKPYATGVDVEYHKEA